MTEPARTGHGRTPWHCACHQTHHAIPSLAADCEDRSEIRVMADAADLVEIRHTLRQIVNVKGD